MLTTNQCIPANQSHDSSVDPLINHFGLASSIDTCFGFSMSKQARQSDFLLHLFKREMQPYWQDLPPSIGEETIF